MSRADRSITKISVNQFSERLKAEVEDIAKAHNWDPAKESHRGWAFQHWVAKLVSEFEAYDAEPEDSVMISPGDLKADIVFDDPTRSHLLICQCKYTSLSKRQPVDEAQMCDFFGRHKLFMQRDWVRTNGSSQAVEALLDYADRVNSDDYRVTYYYVTTGDASDRVREVVQRVNEDFAEKNIAVSCELLDFSTLKDYYVRAHTVGQPGPDELELSIEANSWFEKDTPRKTLVALLTGASLKTLYKRYKETLFNWNIRGYLGSRGINDQIRSTAESKPSDFFYFNNGIAAICTDYSFDKKTRTVVARGFQIINGAQTVGTLSRSRITGEIDVLFRLTKGLDVKSEKGFNRDIIQYNNTQNVIKVSDFRANDPIQIWLVGEFDRQKFKPHVPHVRYIPKRSFQRVPGSFSVRLEELAKIRYSFLYEPTLIHEQPRALWTLGEDGGRYEQAFGVDGEIVEIWPADSFRKTVLAVALFDRLEKRTKELAKQNADNRFYRRLRYHALALMGLAFRERADEEVKKLLSDPKEFERVWETYSKSVLSLISDAHADLDDGTTVSAFVRNPAHWERLTKKFLRRLDVERTVTEKKSSPPAKLR